MTDSIRRVSNHIIINGIPVLGLFCALALSLISYSPLQIKTTILQCGAAIVLAAWAIRSIEENRWNVPGALLPFIAPAFFFMLSAIADFVFVTPSRGTTIEVFLDRISYFVIFSVTALSFSDGKKARRALAWVMTAGFVASVYGLLQHLSLDPLHLGDNLRIQSTFGNPNFYVGFLTLVIPVAAAPFGFGEAHSRKKHAVVIAAILSGAVAYYFLVSIVLRIALSNDPFIKTHLPMLAGMQQSLVWVGRLVNTPSALRNFQAIFFLLIFLAVIGVCIRLKLREKSAAAITLFLLVTNMLMTGSRSGQIGLCAIVLTFLVLTMAFGLFPRPGRKATMLILGIAGLAVLATLAGIRYISYSGQDRLNTVSQRRYYVYGAMELFRQKPIFGHGINTFQNNFPLVKPPASWAYNAACFEHVSNVYNEHLEILHDEGVVGFSLWVWLIAAFLLLTVAAIRIHARRGPPVSAADEVEPWYLRIFPAGPSDLLIGLLSGVIAILIVNVFSLSMRYVSTGIIFWMFLGLLAGQASAGLQGSAKIMEQAPDGAPAVSRSSWRKRAVEGVIVAAALLVIGFSFRVYLADIIIGKAVIQSKNAYVPIGGTDRVFHDIYVEGTNYRSDPQLWDLAIRNYCKALRYNPFDLRGRYFLANAFNLRFNMTPVCNPAWGDKPDEQRTDAQRAFELYEVIYRQAPHFSEIDYEMGDLYEKLGEPDQAIYYYKEYIRYMPFFTKAHYSLAEAYVAKGDWADAAESYKDALDLNSVFTLAYLDLSAVYHKMSKEDLAQEMLGKARDLAPKEADYLMAGEWERFGEPDLAVTSLLTTVAIDSNNIRAYLKLGWCYIQKKKWPDAIRMYERAVGLDPANARAFINLSNLYFETGHSDSAKVALRKAAAIDPEYVRSIITSPPSGE